VSKKARFLLINGSGDHFWRKVLEEALAPLGALQVGSEENAIDLILAGGYDLVFIDATRIKSVPLLIGRMRAQVPGVRAIVITASPTWRRAREAFQAGATDYITKSLNGDVIRSAVQAALVKILPPWSVR
jgi:DNA-binding NtrC family response regulator